MKIFKTALLLALLLAGGDLAAQIGGDYSYQFLQLSPSARATALGGVIPAIKDGDLGLAYHHPAMLSDETHRSIGFHHSFAPGGIGQGLLSYGHSLKDKNIHLQGGIQYIDYGDFQGYDRIGTATSPFSAAEYSFFVGASREIYSDLSMGANFKFISSRLGAYSSTAVAMDLSFLYYKESQRFGASLLIRNLGTQLSLYEEVDENLPLDIQLSVTKRLEHLPFRMGLVMHSLNRWDLSYDDPRLDEQGTLFGDDESTDELGFIDKFSRHLVLSGEFLLGPQENFRLRFSYSNQRRAELKVASFRNLAGFSMGLGLRANRFIIDYGAGIYHVAGTAHHISIRTSLDKFGKDREL